MKLTGGAAWSASERRARDAAAVAARWGEQGVGPACQSKVGSALRGLENEREGCGPLRDWWHAGEAGASHAGWGRRGVGQELGPRGNGLGQLG